MAERRNDCAKSTTDRKKTEISWLCKAARGEAFAVGGIGDRRRLAAVLNRQASKNRKDKGKGNCARGQAVKVGLGREALPLELARQLRALLLDLRVRICASRKTL